MRNYDNYLIFAGEEIFDDDGAPLTRGYDVIDYYGDWEDWVKKEGNSCSDWLVYRYGRRAEDMSIDYSTVYFVAAGEKQV